jgi:UDP-N-acetyl-D-glucosamine dehydrogenase
MLLEDKIQSRRAVVGVIGLGYVGLPLALRFAKENFRVLGFDIDRAKTEKLAKGISYIKHIRAAEIRSALDRFTPTSDMERLCEPDALIICVPTPLNRQREPDLTYVKNTSKEIAGRLRKWQIISLESTTYPGTTREVLLPILEKTGMRVGKDFFLVFSPEREDPGNPDFTTSKIPKVVGGITANCRKLGVLLYSAIIERVVPVSSVEIAEATKLLENIYRAVNIALVNELKVLFDRMGINIWEVIEAAKTKPFGFHPFYPGPGLGGHCIPIDPFYLTWKAREYDFHTKFIELAGEINTLMPYYVIEKLTEGLNRHGRCLHNSRILVLGIAYKKDVDDPRESPGIKIMKILEGKGARVDYHDPFIPQILKSRQIDHPIHSVPLDRKTLARYDAVIIAADHSSIDYDLILKSSRLVVDTRNVYRKKSPKVVKA